MLDFQVSPTAMDSSASWWRTPSIALVISSVFFLLLAFLGQPEGHIDDLGYIGAGMEVARSGVYTNPLFAPKLFSGEPFFILPPTYAYIVALFLKLFGLSSATFALMNAVFMICIVSFWSLVVWSFVGHKDCFTPFCMTGLVFGTCWMQSITEGLGSLRPEPCAYAAFTCGTYLIMQKLAFWKAAGLLLMGLTPTIAPRLAFISLGVGCVVIITDLYRNKGCKKNYLRWLVAVVASISIFILALSWMTDWRLGEFLEVFFASVKVKNPGMSFSRLWSGLRQFFPAIATGYGLILHVPLVVLCCLITITALVKRCELPDMIAGVTIALAFLFWSSGHANYVSVPILYVGLAGILSLQSPTWLPWKKPLYLILAMAVVLHCTLPSLRIVLTTLEIRKLPDEFYRQRVIAAIKSQNPKRLVLDSWAARWLYNYKLPSNSICWSCLHPYGGREVPYSMDDQESGDLWVVSEGLLNSVFPEAWPRPAGVYLLGHRFGTILEKPHRFVLVSSATKLQKID